MQRDTDRRVLVVAADWKWRSGMEFLLRMEGCHVLCAPSGAAGVAVLRHCRWPVVVLLDAATPDAARSLEALAGEGTLGERHGIVVLASSSDLSIPAPAPATGRPAGSVVRTPFRIDALMEHIQRASPSAARRGQRTPDGMPPYAA